MGVKKRTYKNFCQKKLKELVRLDLGSFGRIMLKLHVAIESTDGSE